MDWTTLAAVGASFVAVAKVLDVLTIYRRRAVHDRFLAWWYWMADATPTALLPYATARFVGIIHCLFGPRVVSLRFISRVGMLSVVAPPAALLLAVHLLATPISDRAAIVVGLLFAPITTPVGLVSLAATLWLLRRSGAVSGHSLLSTIVYVLVDIALSLGLWLVSALAVALVLFGELAFRPWEWARYNLLPALFAFSYLAVVFIAAMAPTVLHVCLMVTFLLVHVVAKPTQFVLERVLYVVADDPRKSAFTVIAGFITAILAFGKAVVDARWHLLLDAWMRGHS